MAACVNVQRTISRLILVTWLLAFIIAIIEASGISDLRLCGDKNCERIISYARALGKYRQNDPVFLSFERDDIVHILSKSAGQKPDLWGGEVRGKKGYFPRSFVKEYKVDIPNPQHVVKTEKRLSIEERMMRNEYDTELEDDTEIYDEDDEDADTEAGEEENGAKDVEKPVQEEPEQKPTQKEKEADDTEIDETDLGDNGDDDEEEEIDESPDSTEVPDKMTDDERDKELNKILLTKSPTPNEEKIKESASGEKLESTQQAAPPPQHTDSTQQAAQHTDSTQQAAQPPQHIDSTQQAAQPPQHTDSTQQAAQPPQHTDSTQQAAQPPQHTDSTQQAAQPPQHTDSTQQAAQPPQHTDSTQQANQPPYHTDSTQQADQPPHHTDSTQQAAQPPRHSIHEDKPVEGTPLTKEEKVQTNEEAFDETDIGDDDEDEEDETDVISDVKANLKKAEQTTNGDTADKSGNSAPPEENLQIVSPDQEVKDSKSEDLKQTPSSEEGAKNDDHGADKQADKTTTAADAQKEDENNMKKTSESTHDPNSLDFVQVQVGDAMKKMETEENKKGQPLEDIKIVEQPAAGINLMEQSAEKVTGQSVEGTKEVEQPIKGTNVGEKTEDQGVKEMEQSADGVKLMEQPSEEVIGMKQPSEAVQKEENTKEFPETREPASENKVVSEENVKTEQSSPVTDIPIKEDATGSEKMTETYNLESSESNQPSSANDISATKAAETGAPPGYTIIDGTPFPLDMLDDTAMDAPSPVMEELKTRIPDQSSSSLDIVPTASFSEPVQVTAEPSQSFHTDSRLEVPPFQEPVQSNIEESISQHPSFTVSEATTLSSSETTSLSDRLPLSSDTTQESPVEMATENLQASVSISEQLLSSMDVSVDMEEKPRSTDNIVLNRDTVQQNITHTDSSETVVPNPDSNKDMYATADFLSRKVLSHDGSQGNIPSTDGQPQNGVNIPPVGQTQPEKQVQSETLPNIDDTRSASQNVDTGSIPNLQTDKDQGVTPSTTDSPNEIPPPPVEEKPTATVPPWQQETTAPPEGVDLTGKEGQYNTDSQWSRKINDEGIEAQENKAYQADTWWVRTVRSIDARLKVLVVKLPPSVQSLLEQEPLGLSPQMAIFVTMVMTFTLFIVTCCGLLKGKKSKKKDPVLVVRSLEEQLFIMTKEKENLEDDLQSTKQKMKDLEKDLTVHQSSSGDLETELQNHRLHVDVLKQKLGALEQEKDELTSEIHEKQRDAQSKHESASELHKQLIQKDKMLEELNDLQEKTNQRLSEALVELENQTSQLQGTTEQVHHLETRKQQLLQEVEGWKENAQDLSDRLEQSVSEQSKVQEDLAFKQNELEVLRDCFLQLKAFETEDDEDTDHLDSESLQEKFRAMLDVSKVKASLQTLEEEKATLQNRMDIEIECRQEMEEQIASLQAKLESFQADKMKADRQSHDAQTKLNVLTHYFKEKEVQLQRELGEQEALKKQNKNKLEHADERSKIVEAELETYRSQVEDLKKEILSAERDFRSQIAANEKKAHENWLAARAAERELKESRHDATALRQKLTDLERRLHHGPSGLLRPLPTRGMPPPGMNGPPPPLPPGVDRPGSRGGGPPGPPGIRDGEFHGSPGPERMPPPAMHDRRMPPPGVMGSRMPPPPMDGRSPPPYDRRGPPPPDRRSPPPYERGLRMPPPHMDRRSPGYRMPPPDMLPRMRGPPPPHLRGGPTSPPPPHGSGMPPYHPPPPGQDPDHKPRQQSQV